MLRRATRVPFFVTWGLSALSMFGLAAASVGQDAAGEQALMELRRQSVSVLSFLREKNLEPALEQLGALADGSSVATSPSSGIAAAAGGVHRALTQISADERYDRLHAWSLPSKSGAPVRILTTPVPHVAPPQAFARALRERPRDSSFATAQVGGLRGLVCTGWMLVQAADEIGRLRTLIAELEQLAADEVPQADRLLMLARLAERRPDTDWLSEKLQKDLQRLQTQTTPPQSTSSPLDLTDVAVAAAALNHEPLRPMADAMLGLILQQTYSGSTSHLRPMLRLAQAVAAQRRFGTSDVEALYSTTMPHWIAASSETAQLNATGSVAPLWLAYEGHLLHLAGAGNDVLLFQYPLAGDFDFTCETQVGGEPGTEGGLTYGGLHFEAIGRPEQLTVWDSSLMYPRRRPCPYVRHEAQATFNRVSIRAAGGHATFAANLHPMWTDGKATQSSPWLGLRSFAERRPAFRNVRITGRPTIPRQVQLAQGDQLRGWQLYFGGLLPPPVDGASPGVEPTAAVDPSPPVASTANMRPFEWWIEGGVLHAAKDETAPGTVSQNLLYYQRPLQEDESVRYEFRYEPGQYEVHPALGRLAFLIEPSGVNIHWVTDAELEWTGLAEDNSTLEPLNRRGPRALPLRQKDWNQVAIERAKGKVKVSLNGELIYERDIDFGGQLSFGLYRNARTSAAQVRNVVMTGPWPESLPEDLLSEPASDAEPSPASDARVRVSLYGSRLLSDNVRPTRERAAALPAEARLEQLARWVLPGPEHDDFRVSGEFTPTDPSPLAQALEPTRFPADMRGGQLVSPVYDLLEAAAELGRLEQLREKISEVPVAADEYQRRAQAALLLLVNLELGDLESAAHAAEQLQELALNAQPEDEADMWPETLAVHRGLDWLDRARWMGDLLSSIFSSRTRHSVPAGCENWHARIASLMERYRYFSSGTSIADVESGTEMQDWVPLLRISERPRGLGYPQARWCRVEAQEVRHLSGHHEDYLFFRSPLRGDFEVAGEMGNEATTQFYAAGKYFAPRWLLDEFEIGSFRRGSAIEKIVPPFGKLGPWLRFRAVFHNETCTIWMNGRPVYTERLKKDPSPWIGVRGWSRAVARLRNVQVVGSPEVPEAVRLSASPELIGWVPYYNEPTGGEHAIWQHVEDVEHHGQIRGLKRFGLEGSYCESLLGYQRPLVEGGTIEYEFYYEPAAVEAHPALDRLVLLLAPTGVRIHWLTDGRFDRTQVPPDNLIDEHESRRGPAQLPLRANEWNAVQLTVIGERLEVHLNGQQVYERTLEASNRRTFGIFHYADVTEARVRNVVIRGNWPKSLPSAAKQELADPDVARLDADLARLGSTFSHDFGQAGLPEKYFALLPGDNGQMTVQGDGVHVLRPGPGNWLSSAIKLPFSAVGDFDIEASFDSLRMRGETHSAILLQANIDDDKQHQCRLVRILHRENYHEIDPSLSVLKANGERSYTNSPSACEATSGTLRVARRGARVFYLFAEGDSCAFQLVGIHELTDKPLLHQGIELHALCNGAGDTQVVWKRIALRAQQLKYLPPDQPVQRALYVMRPDGSDLRLVTRPLPGFTHLGSPEWSQDGGLIGLDMSRGPVSTSHIVVVEADGSQPRDLGTGCMPSFSPDCKRIAFSQPGEGVMLMRADGSARERIDASGWGVQWSPDGKYLAYGTGGNITVMNVKTSAKRLLLAGDAATRYSQIYWNLGWSSNSRWIAFKGQNRHTSAYELAVAAVGSNERAEVLYSTAGGLHADFTWFADHQRVLFAMENAELKGSKLFWLQRSAPGEPQLLAGQPLDQQILNGDVSHDGQWIAFTSDAAPQPLDWPLVASP